MDRTKPIAFVVDDKTKQRNWGAQVLVKIGFEQEQIVVCCYGDEAYKKYTGLKEADYNISLVMTDYHMDVTRKPPQDYFGQTRGAKILDGISLANHIRMIDPMQKIVLVSRGLDKSIMALAQENKLCALYKRQPEEAKFFNYVEAIRQFHHGEEIEQTLYTSLLNLNR